MCLKGTELEEEKKKRMCSSLFHKMVAAKVPSKQRHIISPLLETLQRKYISNRFQCVYVS